MGSLTITAARFVAARPDQIKHGMVGFVSLTVNGVLKLDGITLRRTRDGRAALSFPARRDRAGRDHAYVQPLGKDARESIERQVFEMLELDGGAL